MVESFIFDLSSVLYEREQLVSRLSTYSINQAEKKHLISFDKRMEALIESYAATKFTDLERKVFSEFTALIPDISQSGYIYNIDYQHDMLLNENSLLTKRALAKLAMLSDIQTAEGQRLIKESNGIMLQDKSSSQFEIVTLIILAIMIQVILFSSTSLLEKIKQKPHLN